MLLDGARPITAASVAIFSRPLAREQKLDLEAKLPFGAYIGADGVIISANLRIHRLLPNTKDPPDSKAQRHCPLLTGLCLPIRRDEWLEGHIGAGWRRKIVIHEGLHGKRIVLIAPRTAG